MDTLLKGLTVGRKYELACLMLYAEDAFPVDAEVGLVCVWQSSHAGLHARHEVRPRHPRLVTLEANKRLGGLGEVDFAAAEEVDRASENERG